MYSSQCLQYNSSLLVLIITAFAVFLQITNHFRITPMIDPTVFDVLWLKEFVSYLYYPLIIQSLTTAKQINQRLFLCQVYMYLTLMLFFCCRCLLLQHACCSCSILKEHAIISDVQGDYEIRPASLGAKSKVNGTPLTGSRVLSHKDRIMFGWCIWLFRTQNLSRRKHFTPIPVVHHLGS